MPLAAWKPVCYRSARAKLCAKSRKPWKHFCDAHQNNHYLVVSESSPLLRCTAVLCLSAVELSVAWCSMQCPSFNPASAMQWVPTALESPTYFTVCSFRCCMAPTCFLCQRGAMCRCTPLLHSRCCVPYLCGRARLCKCVITHRQEQSKQARPASTPLPSIHHCQCTRTTHYSSARGRARPISKDRPAARAKNPATACSSTCANVCMRALVLKLMQSVSAQPSALSLTLLRTRVTTSAASCSMCAALYPPLNARLNSATLACTMLQSFSENDARPGLLYMSLLSIQPSSFAPAALEVQSLWLAWLDLCSVL